MGLYLEGNFIDLVLKFILSQGKPFQMGHVTTWPPSDHQKKISSTILNSAESVLLNVSNVSVYIDWFEQLQIKVIMFSLLFES